MRFLVDENVPLDVVDRHWAEGHDVSWAQTDYPGADDEVLLGIAQNEKRIVVTFDTHFGTLAFHRNLPASSGVVLSRLPIFRLPVSYSRHLLSLLE